MSAADRDDSSTRMSCVLYIEPIRGNTRPWRAASHAKFTSTYLVLSKGALPKSITAMTLACKRFVTAQRPSTSSCPQVKPSVPHVDLVRAAHSLLLSSAACVALVASPLSAHALPPPSSDPARCSVEALDKFAGEPCAGSVCCSAAFQLPMQARDVTCMQSRTVFPHAWSLSTSL